MLARATGARVPREADKELHVTLAAVQFAGKLKKAAAEKKLGEETWKEKRMHAYQVTHGVSAVPMEPVDVALGAVLFAAKLRKRVSESEAAVLREREAIAAKARRAAAGEVSWTQRRKEAYLRKYGRTRSEETTKPDVAVSAIAFASKLRLRSAGASSGAAPSGPATCAATVGAGAEVDVS